MIIVTISMPIIRFNICYSVAFLYEWESLDPLATQVEEHAGVDPMSVPLLAPEEGRRIVF
jgi:hypothetical protein